MKIRTDTRTGIKFIDYRIGGKRKRVSLGTKNNQVAILKASKIIDDKQANNEGSIAFEAFWQRYFENAKATLRPDTVINLAQLKRRIDKFGAPRTLKDITPSYMDGFKVWLINHEKLSHSSVNAIIGYYKAVISKAELWGLTEVSLKKVKALKTNTERVEFHTQSEILKLLEIAPSFAWNVLVHLDTRTGLRKAELQRLQDKDITFNDNGAEIYVSGKAKGHTFRIIPVRDKELIKKLKKLIQNTKSTEPLFSELGTEISNNYRAWAQKSGFHCFLHKLRHTFASHLAQADVPLQKIQKLLGHANIQTTMKYAHLMPNDLVGAVDRLGTLTGGKKGGI